MENNEKNTNQKSEIENGQNQNSEKKTENTSDTKGTSFRGRKKKELTPGEMKRRSRNGIIGIIAAVVLCIVLFVLQGGHGGTADGSIEVTDANKKGIQALSELVLNKEDLGKQNTVRDFFYSADNKYYYKNIGLYLGSADAADTAEKAFAEAMGISESEAESNYTWLIHTGNQGAYYDADRFGFLIYLTDRGISDSDVGETLPVIRYNTKDDSYETGTIKVKEDKNGNVYLEHQTYEGDE